MPYRRTSTAGTRGRTAGTQRGAAPRRRRRTSVATRARYQRGAAAQSRQIQELARIAVRNARTLNAQRTYTDYYLNGSSDATWTTGVWKAWSIVDPVTWQQTLRRNSDADLAQNAYVRNMFFQHTTGLFKLKASASVTLMLVSIRPQAANFVPSASTMGSGEEWQFMGAYQMPVVNSQLMHVKWSKTFILQSNGLNGPSVAQATDTAVGDPSDTFSRGSVNMDIRTTFYSPSRLIAPATEPQSWSTLQDTDLRPSQRLYLLAYFQSNDTQNAAQLNWSAKFTVVTSN